MIKNYLLENEEAILIIWRWMIIKRGKPLIELLGFLIIFFFELYIWTINGPHTYLGPSCQLLEVLDHNISSKFLIKKIPNNQQLI